MFLHQPSGLSVWTGPESELIIIPDTSNLPSPIHVFTMSPLGPAVLNNAMSRTRILTPQMLSYGYFEPKCSTTASY